ncbi:DMT family transporter [bacterium]|nr:DMT family transporter [bacterium]
MRAEIWAVLTAVCWSCGSVLEKKGVKLGQLSPVMGTTIRTFFSLMLLSFLSFPYWKQLKTCGTKSISLIAIGGGVIAGGLGIVFLYTGLKSGHISVVLAIAFCLTPVIGSILGYVTLGEKLSNVQITGVVFCILGVFMLTFFKK